MSEYSGKSDAELIRLLRAGDEQVMDFLMDKYKYLVRKRANALFLLGGDTDDLIQEGMIGLFKAVRDYEESAGSFAGFAQLCINRQMYTAIESAARKKHVPLNSYISLSEDDDGREREFSADFAAANDQNPEQMMIERENIEEIAAGIKDQLSPLEQSVLDLSLEGLSYRQIAEELNRPEKSIDNALQRIRGKIIDF